MPKGSKASEKPKSRKVSMNAKGGASAKDKKVKESAKKQKDADKKT